MTIESILKRKGIHVATIAPEANVRTASDWLRAKNIGALLVTGGDAIVGIISERDIVRAFSHYGETLTSMRVKDIMVYPVVTVKPDDSIGHAMRLMTQYHVRHLPVVSDRKLMGIISIGDVVKHRLDDLQLETNVLRDAYIATHR
jgi:CBS domain-containing protein